MTAAYRLFIDGEFRDAVTGRTFEDRSPVDDRLVANVAEAGAADVDLAVRAAQRALRGPWGRMGAGARARVLHRIADGIEARFDDFLRAEIDDTGKPEALARRIDIPRGAANFRVFARLIQEGDQCFHQDLADGRRALHYTIRHPVGVVGVICPWNLPLLLMTWKLAPALACGNTIVAKPSEETPGTATLLGEVMAEAGVPEGVFNVVHGFGPGGAGEAIVRHPGTRLITFTGETTTGAAIAAAAAPGIKAVSFELGGKNPALVFADADFDEAVAGVAKSTFTNCGQVCLCAERVYVARPLFEPFCEALAEAAGSLRAGDPYDEATTLGPLISKGHREKVLSYYAAAEEAGATIRAGGHALEGPRGGGCFVEPTIWTGLPDDARVNREEIFGPVCHLAPFDTESEAIARANDTQYGLAACVWTRDLDRAHRAARALEAGLVWVNTWFLRDLRTPFGGVKLSGIGREGGLHSLDCYSEWKTVSVALS